MSYTAEITLVGTFYTCMRWPQVLVFLPHCGQENPPSGSLCVATCSRNPAMPLDWNILQYKTQRRWLISIERKVCTPELDNFRNLQWTRKMPNWTRKMPNFIQNAVLILYHTSSFEFIRIFCTTSVQGK